MFYIRSWCRLWKRGRQPERYFLSLRKVSEGGSAAASIASATGLQPNRHKRAAGVILASAVRGKKMKFGDD
jgi:hypothetical protein